MYLLSGRNYCRGCDSFSRARVSFTPHLKSFFLPSFFLSFCLSFLLSFLLAFFFTFFLSFGFLPAGGRRFFFQAIFETFQIYSVWFFFEISILLSRFYRFNLVFHWALPSFARRYLVLPGFTGSDEVFSGFWFGFSFITGFYLVLLSFT